MRVSDGGAKPFIAPEKIMDESFPIKDERI